MRNERNGSYSKNSHPFKVGVSGILRQITKQHNFLVCGWLDCSCWTLQHHVTNSPLQFMAGEQETILDMEVLLGFSVFMAIQGLVPLLSRATMVNGTNLLQSVKVRLSFWVVRLWDAKHLTTRKKKWFFGPTGICPRPRTPSRGRLLDNKARFIEGDQIRFSCNSGYDLFGNAKLRCVGRNWDSREPVCKGEFVFLLKGLRLPVNMQT